VHKPEIYDWLASWASFAERYWTTDPDRSSHGWFGTGYNSWGVQTNQKYAAAMVALATEGSSGHNPVDVDREWASERAVAA